MCNLDKFIQDVAYIGKPFSSHYGENCLFCSTFRENYYTICENLEFFGENVFSLKNRTLFLHLFVMIYVFLLFQNNKNITNKGTNPDCKNYLFCSQIRDTVFFDIQSLDIIYIILDLVYRPACT